MEVNLDKERDPREALDNQSTWMRMQYSNMNIYVVATCWGNITQGPALMGSYVPGQGNVDQKCQARGTEMKETQRQRTVPWG